MMTDRFKQALQEIVGPENFTAALIDLVSFSADASENRARPDCAVWATTTDQVARIMRLAHEAGVPVIPRGAGTGLTGMAVPARGGIVLDLARMNKILRISIEDRLAVVQPGVVYAHLEKALAPHGFFFPPDPASGKVSTLGGNVATNAGGVRGAKYGTTRDYVLGLEVVLADGRVTRTGARTMKCVSGYDLTRLFVGSEGTLGVVTEITLKINPRPTALSTARAAFPTIEDAGRAVTQTMHSGIVPAVCEVLDYQSMRLVLGDEVAELPETAAMILVETDGFTQAEADFQMAKIMEVFQANKALQVRRAASRAEAEQIWQARKALYGTISKVKPNLVLDDVTVPMSKVPELLQGIAAIAAKRDITIINFGHAGDGNLHPNVLFDSDIPGQAEVAEAAGADIFRLACDLGGTLTGEHGIGLTKAAFMTWEHDETAMWLMRSLKKLLDPKNILNPGKMSLEG